MVDGSHTVIMGLPPPKDGWITARNYGLTESLKMLVVGVSGPMFRISCYMGLFLMQIIDASRKRNEPVQVYH
jgi:hypothetical protein